MSSLWGFHFFLSSMNKLLQSSPCSEPSVTEFRSLLKLEVVWLVTQNTQPLLPLHIAKYRPWKGQAVHFWGQQLSDSMLGTALWHLLVTNLQPQPRAFLQPRPATKSNPKQKCRFFCSSKLNYTSSNLFWTFIKGELHKVGGMGGNELINTVSNAYYKAASPEH